MTPTTSQGRRCWLSFRVYKEGKHTLILPTTLEIQSYITHGIEAENRLREVKELRGKWKYTQGIRFETLGLLLSTAKGQWGRGQIILTLLAITGGKAKGISPVPTEARLLLPEPGSESPYVFCTVCFLPTLALPSSSVFLQSIFSRPLNSASPSS